MREATEALAVHHEHRARDLPAAKAFALQSLSAVAGVDPPRNRTHDLAVRHRLARIERKMGKSQDSRLTFEPAAVLRPEGLIRETGAESNGRRTSVPSSRPSLPSSGFPTSGRHTSS
jgi:hypothetical protein